MIVVIMLHDECLRAERFEAGKTWPAKPAEISSIRERTSSCGMAKLDIYMARAVSFVDVKQLAQRQSREKFCAESELVPDLKGATPSAVASHSIFW